MTKRRLFNWAIAGLVTALLTISVRAEAQTVLATDARYPRVRLLPGGELVASVLSSPNDSSVRTYSSTDHGASFTQVGAIDDPEFKPHRTSSPSLFRMPRAVGSLAEGTLILALNVDTTKCETCRSRIKVYKSTDQGRHWSFVSTAARAANRQGLWEPDFSIATDGALVMHYADETDSCCSQKLVRQRTFDGVNWINQADTVALSSSGERPERKLRPGMPVVSFMKDGTYLMTYEVCGQPAAIDCRSYFRVSADGWDYGPPTALGSPMQDGAGRYFTNTPVHLAFPDGAILWTGQYLRNADGGSSEYNGRIIFKSESGSPSGPWTMVKAPVSLPTPVFRGCEGFSPGLAWTRRGTLVQLTSRKNAFGHCDMFFGTGKLRRVVQTERPSR
jgi:hypothetical protein